MKTTLNIDDSLLADAKVLAVRQRTSLTKLIEEGLRMRLAKPDKTVVTPLPSFPVFDGKSGMRPGIDPKSNKSMLAALGDDS